MFDINLIRKDITVTKEKMLNKKVPSNLFDQIFDLDVLVRNLMQQEQNLNAKKNQLSKEIAILAKNKDPKLQQTLDLVNSIKNELQNISLTLSNKQDELNKLLLVIPNMPDDSVPIGNDENDNVEIKKVFEPKKFNFLPLAHWDLAVKNKLIDFDKSTKITGSRFIIYTNFGARLYRALQQFCLDMNVKAGFNEIWAPVIVNQESLIGSGNLPKFADDLFKLENSNYYLSPTAEVQLTNLHRNEILKASDLPLYYTALTPCFRSEAGSAGRDVRGVIRQHQFHKVELVKLCKPEDSFKELESMTRQAESILEALELPYRRIVLCTGDLGFSSAKTYDLEVWLPSYNAYKEISSCSNCTNFQARRAKIRYKETIDATTELVHTLNGSSLAIDRLWAAIVENYQQEDGSINIPKALKKYIY